MRLALSLAGLLMATPAFAHDFWLQPETFRPAAGKPFALRLLVGDGLEVESERAFEKKPSVQFKAINAAGPRDLSSVEGATPFAKVVLDRTGTHWIALERERKTLRLEAEKFNDYLKEEGLDAILDQRRLAKEDAKPARERYTRWIKCLVRCGEKTDDTWKKPLGHRLEIVPLDDPFSLSPGNTLRVRVLFAEKPLPGVALFALHREGGKVHKHKLTTTAEGTAEVKLSHAGAWLLRMVHMRRCPDTADADWESFWTALTLEIEAKK